MRDAGALPAPLWMTVSVIAASNMKEAVSAAKKHKSQANPQGHWKWSNNPGNGKTYSVLQCNAHKHCPHQLMVKLEDGQFLLKEKGDHAEELNLKKRSNSGLTFTEHAAVVDQVNSGARPAGILSAMTSRKAKELKEAGEDPADEKHKREEGGLKGVCTMYVLSILLQCTTSVLGRY